MAGPYGEVTAGPIAGQGGSSCSSLPAGEEADPAISIPAVPWHSPSPAGLGPWALPTVANTGCLAAPDPKGHPLSHQPWRSSSSGGDTPKGFRLCLSPRPGFSDKQVLTQSCLSLTCLLRPCLCQLCCSWLVGLCYLHLLLVQPIFPAGRTNTCSQQRKLAISETNPICCRNICFFTCIYTSVLQICRCSATAGVGTTDSGACGGAPRELSALVFMRERKPMGQDISSELPVSPGTGESNCCLQRDMPREQIGTTCSFSGDKGRH